MKKAKKILFPTDFSENSANAFRYALLLADQLKASIEVLHATMPILDPIPYTGYSGSTTEAIIMGLKEQTKAFVELGMTQVLEHLQHAPVISSDVILGTPINAIIHHAKRENCHFILMGSRGENKPIIGKLLGSIAVGVVEKASCPVIVIPEYASFQPELTIAYATDLSVADPFEIWKAIKLLSPLMPNVRVIHIRLPNENAAKGEEKMRQIESFFTKHRPEINIYFHTIPGKDLQKELETFTTIYKTDMVVMYQPHHSLWNKLFFQSNTKKIAAHTQLPLLIQKN